ncbi:thrombospondin type 3 repeat-containing protein [Luteolibacter flavescens]|uniref:Thrombospondin type 3 repeat-containing protein n=1 Tax=Luteolibacter flavescens TaxID=1859460 RepID=A0ABT3FM92_9BACT|nr:thrombospondin type 3 repeat-containing protein [Luteolibacter flavescens]MCW1884376.1 thrombospondin type 3 repeat-containing protein [Luteolibacter flavescens]
MAATLAAASAVPTRGFEVDTSDRNSVVAHFQSVYRASEGYRDRMEWTGNFTSTAAGAEGTVSPTFVGDVERRVNYFRALCGVPANVRVNSGSTVNIQAADAHKPDASTTKAAAAQRSALMIVRNYPSTSGMNHNPAQSNVAWTAAAWNANRNGNLALGYFGPGAVDSYVKEDVSGVSNWNVDVGHRRWLMSHWSTDFATGDTPGRFSGNSVLPPTNALYVVPKVSEVDFSVAPLFHAFPAAGYFPARHNTPYWSLSHSEADFSSATVTMSDSSMTAVPVTVVSRREGSGDNSLVWQVPASVSAPSFPADTTFHVTVSNIKGDKVPSQYTYQVTLINPNRLNESGVITGGNSPVASGATYQVGGLNGVDQIEAGMFQRKAATWSEGSEDGTTAKIISSTSSTYAFNAAVSGYAKSGSKAFRLTFPTRYDPLINGVPRQLFRVDREILPGNGATLNFHYRRGLMTPASKLAVESSTDGGLTWVSLLSISGAGSSGDSAFQSSSVPLAHVGVPTMVRFRYYLSDSTAALYAHEDYPSHPTGIFIDDISVSGSDWLESSGSVKSSGLQSFTFSSATAGTTLSSGQTWWLRARAHLGGRAFPWGAAKVVSPRGVLELSGTSAPPLSGANYDFIPDPQATSYLLEVSAPGGGVWTEGAETSPVPHVSSQISTAYSLYSDLAGYRKSGARSFRLGMATTTDTEELFTIERDTIPTSASTLEFWTRRGPMAKTNLLHAEVSTNGGDTWTSLWSLPGTTKADSAVTKQSVSLSAYAGKTVKVRFALRNSSGSNLKWNAKTSGVWIDDITVTSPSPVLWSKETSVSPGATTVSLSEFSAGHPLVIGQILHLRVRSMNGATAGAWGPSFVVTPTSSSAALTGFAAYQVYEYPSVTLSFEGDADGDGMPDGLEYAFSTDPTQPTVSADEVTVNAARFEISRDLPVERPDVDYRAQWSDDLKNWSEAGVEIRIEGGKIIASAPRVGSSRMMRWLILEKQ